MRISVILVLFFALNGCTVIPLSVACLDHKIPRSTKLHSDKFEVTIQNTETGKITNKVVQCEKYYDSQCSVRGNSWKWRSTEPQEIYQFDISDNRSANLEYANCKALVNENELKIKYSNYHTYKKSEGIYYYIESYKTMTKKHFSIPIVWSVKKI